MTVKNVELLAPAGSMESLYAAVQNGACAVYLGGKLFNARQYASNFDNDKLKEAVEYCHLRNVKVYVTVNILIDDREMRKVLDYIKYLYHINVDGIIVQDLGLAYIVKDVFPDLELHASTQMTINNLQGAIFLKKLGFKRVVLARETPIDEIKRIHENVDIELEAFVHGALCVSYSGQCLMSSILGGRSGNRGKCAQPCRMAYSIIDYNKNSIPFKEWDKKYIISPKDLNTLDNLRDLINAGVVSLKIEGRMKRPEYVATVVNAYRKAIDMGIFSLTRDEKLEVEQIFNRGFTKGLMLGEFGRKFISYDRPNNRGVYAGEVVKIDRNNIYIKLSMDVEKGDGIEFVNRKGEYFGLVLETGGLKGETIRIEKKYDVKKGSKVYRTSSSKLLEKAKKSFMKENIKFPIDMKVDISIGKPINLSVKMEDNIVNVKSDYIVEKGIKLYLTEERVIEQFSKLNNTVYFVNKIDVNIEEGSFMPISALNAVRRKAIEELNRLRIGLERKEISDLEYKDRIQNHFRYKKGKHNLREISISINSIEQFEKLDLNKVDRLYIGFNENLKEFILKAKSKNVEVYLNTDRIMYEDDFPRLKDRIDSIKDIIDGVSVSNLGTLQFIKENYDLKIHGNIGLNIFNSFTIKALEKLGLDSVTLSLELNLKQIKEIAEKTSIKIETIGYGYLPLMIMKHCPMSLVKDCKGNSNCEMCKYSKGYGLKDRKGLSFYMERKNNITTIYNSVPLMVVDKLDRILDSGVDMVRLDFVFEKEIERIQNIYYLFGKGLISKEEVNRFFKEYKDKGFTKGHYYRGII